MKCFQVLVTYGTHPDREYARTDTIRGARALRSMAESLGYDDARIKEWKSEKDLEAHLREKCGSEADTARTDRPRR